MPIIRWIHISDIHVKAPHDRFVKYHSDKVLDALWEDISNRGTIDNRLQCLDFAFISGDLAFSGTEYNEVFARIIDPLIMHCGLSSNRIFMVPGNHDIVRDAVDDDALRIEDKIKRNTAELDKMLLYPESKEAQKLFSRQSNFISFTKEKLPHLHITEHGSYSCEIKIREEILPMRIIGLNSSWLAFGGDEDMKKLVLGEPIVSELYKTTPNNLLTISLVHHPLIVVTEWYSDLDSQSKGYVVRNSDFILSGHVHKPDVSQFMNLQGPCIEIVSGSIFENEKWDSNSYNYVVYDTDQRVGTCYLRRYDPQAGPGRFMQDTRSTWRDNGSGKVSIKNKKEDVHDGKDNRTAISTFINNQQDDLKKRPLLSEFPSKEAISFLIPELYIDPHVKPQKKPEGDPILLSKWLKKYFFKNMKILILGPPGIGKTTSLISICHELSDTFLQGSDSIVPFFYEALEYNWENRLSLTDVLNFARSNYELDDDCAKLIGSDTSLSPFVLMDAIDEAFPSVHQKYEALELTKLNFNFPHIATCRTDFFSRNLEKTEFARQYDEILVIDEWQLDREATTFLQKYLVKIPAPDIDSTISEIKRYLKLSMPLNPLTVTAYLFLWREEREDLKSQPIRTYGELLKRFVYLWARRESEKSKCFREPAALLIAYEMVALTIYKEGTGKLTFRELLKKISVKMNIKYETLLKDRALPSILRFKRNRASNLEEDNFVISFSHESIHESLIAQLIVKSLQDEIKDENILSNLIGRTINQLVRDLFTSYSHDDISHISKKLYDKYMRSIKERDSLFSSVIDGVYKVLGQTSKVEMKNEQEIIRRHNLCYFLGRIEEIHEIGYSIQLFQKLFTGEILDHAIVMTTVGSSMLFIHNKEYEIKYIKRVLSGDNVDVCNRMYHLVYYGDASITSPDSFIKWKCTSWSKTYEQIIKRLSSAEKRHHVLRSLDLVTFKRLSETCGMPALSVQDREVIRNCINNLSVSEEKNRIINDECKKLIQQLGI